MPIEILELVLFPSIKNIVDSSNTLRSAIINILKVVSNLSLISWDFYSIKPNLFRYTVLYLKDKFTNENDYQDTLIWAAKFGYTEIVRLLIAAGANVNHKNKSGDTVLMWAVRNRHQRYSRIAF